MGRGWNGKNKFAYRFVSTNFRMVLNISLGVLPPDDRVIII
jgi:hypothetical protein